MDFIYSTQEEYDQENCFLRKRFEEAKTVKGTQQYHSYQPKNEIRVSVKTNCFANDVKEEVVSINDVDSDLEVSAIVGFVTCEYDSKWWLGCVLGVEDEHIKMSFLEPHGPSWSFTYPAAPDILSVNKIKVLTKVDPTTQTGRVYHLTDSEMARTNKKLQSKLKGKQ